MSGECTKCRDNLPHDWVGERISETIILHTQPIHEYDHCACYLCLELGDKCPNCGTNPGVGLVTPAAEPEAMVEPQEQHL